MKIIMILFLLLPICLIARSQEYIDLKKYLPTQQELKNETPPEQAPGYLPESGFAGGPKAA